MVNVNVSSLYPLPFTCGNRRYKEGTEDGYENPKPDWEAAETRACVWWTPTSHETPHEPAGGDRVQADLLLALASEIAVDHRDRFEIDGQPFEVQGIPQDYDHGPFGVSPGRRVVQLKWIG